MPAREPAQPAQPARPPTIGWVVDRAREIAALVDERVFREQLAALAVQLGILDASPNELGQLVAITRRISDLLIGAWAGNAALVPRLRRALFEPPSVDPVDDAFDALAIRGDALSPAQRYAAAARRATQQPSDADRRKQRVCEELGREIVRSVCSSVYLGTIDPQKLIDAREALGRSGSPADQRHVDVLEVVIEYRRYIEGDSDASETDAIERLRCIDDAFDLRPRTKDDPEDTIEPEVIRRTDDELRAELADAFGPRNDRSFYAAAAALALSCGALGNRSRGSESSLGALKRVTEAFRAAAKRCGFEVPEAIPSKKSWSN